MKIIIAVLLLLGHLAAAEVQYYGTGGSLVLGPKFSGAITSITWKHKGNIVAEWIDGSVDLEYLGDLKGRLDLNLKTGVLTVKNMMKADQGVFSVEINNKVLPDTFEATWIRILNDSEVVVIPSLTCSSQSQSCSLRCGEEIKDAGPIQYFWKKGENGKWEEGERTIEIENTDETGRFKTFSCKAENPVSEKESKPEENPFNKTDPVNWGTVFGIVIGLIIAAVAVGVTIYMRKNKMFCFRPPVQNQTPKDQTGNGESETLNQKTQEV
ncbi:uncharacterized protein LOC119785067 [Cyprinodon tularosa]|uniref:uncharacterized protein LOC119785067 n=1 Tax=Cyprinodon tularosa TaxID=77115 RepID=UPI0018E26CB8|nr:uncharacterized protein LOC119785067 [Cyprinodon tularosa]